MKVVVSTILTEANCSVSASRGFPFLDIYTHIWNRLKTTCVTLLLVFLSNFFCRNFHYKLHWDSSKMCKLLWKHDYIVFLFLYVCLLLVFVLKDLFRDLARYIIPYTCNYSNEAHNKCIVLLLRLYFLLRHRHHIWSSTDMWPNMDIPAKFTLLAVTVQSWLNVSCIIWSSTQITKK